jgi:hypothetical protein
MNFKKETPSMLWVRQGSLWVADTVIKRACSFPPAQLLASSWPFGKATSGPWVNQEGGQGGERMLDIRPDTWKTQLGTNHGR